MTSLYFVLYYPLIWQSKIVCRKLYSKKFNLDDSSIYLFLFNCYLAVLWPTLGHSQGDSLANPMLITAFVQVQPEGHQEPRNKVGSLSPAECLVGFEQGTFQFWLRHLNPLAHSPFLSRTILNINDVLVTCKFVKGTLMQIWKSPYMFVFI